MGNGRRMKAPCGHLGEAVIGTYVQCLRCDKDAAPAAVAPEKTEPMRAPQCPGCSSNNIERFPTDVDAAIWYLTTHLIPTGPVQTPVGGEWGCNSCARVFSHP